MAPQVTLGILATQLSTMQAGIDDIKHDLKVVTDQALDRRLSKMEDTVRWLTRTVAGTLLAAVASIIVAVVTR